MFNLIKKPFVILIYAIWLHAFSQIHYYIQID
jgi:hypothetical protein